jgi:hypothetical protein
VHDILAVKVVYSLEQLVDEKLNACSVKAIRLFFKDLKEVSIHEFKN